jgi:hypothetical protein
LYILENQALRTCIHSSETRLQTRTPLTILFAKPEMEAALADLQIVPLIGSRQ